MNFKSLIAVLLALIYFIILELANYYGAGVLWLGPLSLFFGVFCLFFLRRFFLKEKDENESIFFLSPFLFFLGVIFIFVFLDRSFFRQILIFSSACLFFIYFIYAITFLISKESYARENLLVLREIFPALSFFFLTSGFFGWLVFLNKIFWVFFLLVILISFLTSREIFNAGKIKKIAPNLLISLLAGEFFWSLYFLPIGFLSRSFILTVVWLALIKLSIEFLQEKKSVKRIGFISFFSLFLIILALLISRWI